MEKIETDSDKRQAWKSLGWTFQDVHKAWRSFYKSPGFSLYRYGVETTVQDTKASWQEFWSFSLSRLSPFTVTNSTEDNFSKANIRLNEKYPFSCVTFWIGRQGRSGWDAKRANWSEVEDCRTSWRPFWTDEMADLCEKLPIYFVEEGEDDSTAVAQPTKTVPGKRKWTQSRNWL